MRLYLVILVTLAWISITTNSLPKCKSGRVYSNHCYEAFEKYVEYSEAKAYCQTWGGYVAEVNSEDENTFISNYANGALTLTIFKEPTTEQMINNQSIWLGMTVDEHSDWHTGKNESILQQYFQFGPQQPDNWHGNEFCATMWLANWRPNYFGQWADVPCQEKIRFVCEKEITQSDTDMIVDEELIFKIDQPFGVKLAPPQPRVFIKYDEASQRFNFKVETDYLRERTQWILDLQPWNETRSIFQFGTCENRVSDSFNNKSFSDIWSSADNALMKGALGGDHLSYSNPGEWNLTALNGYTVQYNRDFTFSELLGCRDLDGRQLIGHKVINITDQQVVQYYGQFYVTLVNPVDIDNANAGLSYITYTFPFSVQFTIFVHNTYVPYQDLSFQMKLQDIALTPASGTTIHIDTQLNSQYGSYLTNPQLISVSGGANLTIVPEQSIQTRAVREARCELDSSNNCNQRWFIDSSSLASGTYEISFTKMECSASSCIQAESQQELGRFHIEADTIYSTLGLKNRTKVATTTFSDSDFTQISQTLDTTETVNILSVGYLDNQPSNELEISIKNVYICYAHDSHYVVDYNPDANLYGCVISNSSKVTSDTVYQLVSEGRLTSNDRVSNYAATIILSAKGFEGINRVGISFEADAVPLNRAVYVHIETQLKNKTAEAIASNSPSQLAVVYQNIIRIEVEKVVNSHNLGIILGSIAAAVVGGIFLCCMIVVLYLCIVEGKPLFMAYHKARTNEHKELQDIAVLSNNPLAFEA
jgi:hypothetical protein